MFTDRLWILKAAATLGLLGWLCTHTRQDLLVRHPKVEWVALFPDWIRGRTFYLLGEQVQEVDATGFEIDTKVGSMRVLSAAQPPLGGFVTIKAQATAPRTLEAVSLLVHSGYSWKRRLNYVISVITVIGYLWLVRRRFRWKIQEGVFRSKY